MAERPSQRLVPCQCPWCKKGLSRHNKVPIGHRWDGFGGRGVLQLPDEKGSSS